MKEKKEKLFTLSKIAEQLSVSASKVKKAIQDLKIQPTAKKGACNYYSKNDIPKIKKVIK